MVLYLHSHLGKINRALSSVGSEHPDFALGGFRFPKNKDFGRVAQLVQSTWFTPKGSGVRIPSRPQRLPMYGRPFSLHDVLHLYIIFTDPR